MAGGRGRAGGPMVVPGRRAIVRWRVGTVGVVAIVALAAIGGGLSCRQIVGVTDNPPTDLTTSACGLRYGTTTCTSCASASCCNEATACAASSVCVAFETCLADCSQGDFACRARCQIDRPVGTSSEVSALSACLVSHCENDCGLTCGALAGWAVEPDTAVAFQNCMASTSSSCARARACARSPACDAVVRCLAACPTDDCVTTCTVSNGADPAWCFPDARRATRAPRSPASVVLLTPARPAGETTGNASGTSPGQRLGHHHAPADPGH